MKLSESITGLRYSVIREMSQLAAGMENVISLGIGEPDFDTPEEITARAFEDTRAGHTHYTPSQGDPELVQRLVEEVSDETGVTISPASMLITHGAMGALAAAFRTLLEPGDEVIVIEPYFPDYLAHITFAGGKIVPVATRFEDRFVPDTDAIAAAVTPKTRVILLNYPNNPTGTVLPGTVLDQIAMIACQKDLVVISDEVYDRIAFETLPGGIYTRTGMAERTLVIKSFSKTYAMTGWRVGFCFGPEELMAQMIKVVNYSTACASSVGQRAALAALDINSEVLEGMARTFEKRVGLVCKRLETMPGIRTVRPQGSFYVFVDISGVANRSREFAIGLLEKKQVVVVPGYAFGASCDRCIRIACTLPEDQLAQAMDRLEDYLSAR